MVTMYEPLRKHGLYNIVCIFERRPTGFRKLQEARMWLRRALCIIRKSRLVVGPTPTPRRALDVILPTGICFFAFKSSSFSLFRVAFRPNCPIFAPAGLRWKQTQMARFCVLVCLFQRRWSCYFDRSSNLRGRSPISNYEA